MVLEVWWAVAGAVLSLVATQAEVTSELGPVDRHPYPGPAAVRPNAPLAAWHAVAGDWGVARNDPILTAAAALPDS